MMRDENALYSVSKNVFPQFGTPPPSYETNTHFIGFPHFHYFISTYRPVQLVMHFLTRRFSNHVSRLLSRSHTFAIIVFIRFENTSKYVDILTLFSKNLNQRSLTPRWPLTPCLLRSHVKGSEPKGPICILAILRKSALKILAMFEVQCRAYWIKYVKIYKLNACTIMFLICLLSISMFEHDK